MTQAALLCTAVAVLSSAVEADEITLDPLEQWPQWRGPLGTGVAPRGNPPVEWSEQKNVRWKVAIPGQGHSTPIVWGDRVFITTAVPHGAAVAVGHEHVHADGAHDNMEPGYRQQFVVMAVERRDGSIAWERRVRDEHPHESTHETGTWASNSAVTDGEYLIAYFGSRGLYALDLDGGLVWERDFGDMQTFHGHGEGSSPALSGDTLVVNWDHQGDSFVVALNKRTGEERWKAARDEITSWSTPLIAEHGGRRQVIVAATKRVRSYDLETGKVIWECSGLSRNVVASPVAADGFVYVANSYDWQAMMAIDLSKAKGDITKTNAVVWTRDRDTPYVPSPLLYGDTLYFLKHNQGFLTAVNAKTGATVFGPKRLGIRGMVFASPVGAADRVYVVSRDGTTLVIEHGNSFATMARNRLDDSFSASPAIVGNELYLRGERNLYCIAE